VSQVLLDFFITLTWIQFVKPFAGRILDTPKQVTHFVASRGIDFDLAMGLLVDSTGIGTPMKVSLVKEKETSPLSGNTNHLTKFWGNPLAMVAGQLPLD
jgi:hypothetical protein